MNAGRDEPHGQIVVVDPLRQRRVHRIDLRPHAEVALAVAERADDAPHGIVHLGDVLAQEAGGADALDVASGVPRNETVAAHGAAILSADHTGRAEEIGRGTRRSRAG